MNNIKINKQITKYYPKYKGMYLYPDNRFKNRYYDFENEFIENEYNESMGIDIPAGTKFCLTTSITNKKYIILEKNLIIDSVCYDVLSFEE